MAAQAQRKEPAYRQAGLHKVFFILPCLPPDSFVPLALK